MRLVTSARVGSCGRDTFGVLHFHRYLHYSHRFQYREDVPLVLHSLEPMQEAQSGLELPTGDIQKKGKQVKIYNPEGTTTTNREV
jgi:hypothetical protein